MADAEIATPSGPMPNYVARPSGAGPWPGIVLIHDAFGAGGNLQRHAEWLAGCGYLVAAPNLLHWARKFTCLRAVMKDVAVRQGRSFDDVEATRLWLKEHDECTGMIGVIGFCMGGAFAMLLAPRGGYDVAAPNYGKVPKDADSYFAGACPMVASFGGRDPTLPGAGGKLERALVQNGVAHDLKVYPSASHGFMDDHSRDPLPWPIVVAKTILNIGYDKASAEDAQRRIEAFFALHLR